MYEQLVQNTSELNMAARHLRMLGGFDEIKKLAKKWLVSRQDTEDFIKSRNSQGRWKSSMRRWRR